METQIILGGFFLLALGITFWRIGEIRGDLRVIQKILLKTHNDSRRVAGLPEDVKELFDGSGGLRHNGSRWEIYVSETGEWKQAIYNEESKKWEPEVSE